ncbi:MAG TPA: hypothetical protein VEM35_02400 [Rhizomicrobium sp.]|nr:hypothetical protein [Rhizomicrobium sp.]
MLQRKKSVIVSVIKVFRHASGGGRGRLAKAAVAMKQISSHLLLGCVMALGLALSPTAQGAAVPVEQGTTVPASDPSLCLDSMETVPINDDLEPIPIAVDGGCQVPQAVISI